MPREVVLVVDDYTESRVAIRDLLEDHGYEVAEAANGQQALDFLAGGAPRVQLIILDLQMPIMDGWQLLTLLDSYIRLSAIPVLVVSGHQSLPSRETHPAIAACLKVPYRADELLALVNDCCKPSESDTAASRELGG
jgi:CheY-like chemotaxis protein